MPTSEVTLTNGAGLALVSSSSADAIILPLATRPSVQMNRAWAVPGYTNRPNVRYIGITGNDREDGLTEKTAWRNFQNKINQSAIPDDCLLKVTGDVFSANDRGGEIFDDRAGHALPNNLTIIPNNGYRKCTLDGQNSVSNLFTLWYPNSAVRNFEVWGFKFRRNRTIALGGGTGVFVIAGDYDGIRLIGNDFSESQPINGSMDHVLYIAGGLEGAVSRNIVVRHNTFVEYNNNGSLIKIGSGGPGTAGRGYGKTIGHNSTGVDIQYNYFECDGWGPIYITGEYKDWIKANSKFSNNIIVTKNSNLREYDGSPCKSQYSGAVYFTWNAKGFIGCDESFLVEDNRIRITESDQYDWHCIYNLKAPASVTQNSPHRPTINRNRMSHVGAASRLLAGAEMGTNVQDNNFSTEDAALLFIEPQVETPKETPVVTLTLSGALTVTDLMGEDPIIEPPAKPAEISLVAVTNLFVPETKEIEVTLSLSGGLLLVPSNNETAPIVDIVKDKEVTLISSDNNFFILNYGEVA